MTDRTETFEGWAILELMGHRRLAGYVCEVEIAGQGMLRLDVPGCIITHPNGEQDEQGGATQFYSPGALYCLTPTTEEIARALAEKSRPEPVTRWELPPAPFAREEQDDAEDLDEHDLSEVADGLPF